VNFLSPQKRRIHLKKADIKFFWQEISEVNGWKDPLLLKNLSPDRTPGFPYSRGGFRNRVTGRDADPELSKKIFQIGKFPAIRRADLVDWLDSRTTEKRRPVGSEAIHA
jgi:hypothetical protein